MKQGESHIKDTRDFLENLKRVGEIPKGAILVTADVVGLYPSIPYDGGLNVLRKQYDKFKDKIVPTEDIIKMGDFVLNNNFLNLIVSFISKCQVRLLGLNLPRHMLAFLWTMLKRNS